MNCIFCAIVNKTLNAHIVLETEHVIAFHDINKVSDVHILIIPKKHAESLTEVGNDEAVAMGEMMLTAKKLAEQFKLDKTGYRLVVNTGKDAGQSVFHLHMHLLGGRHFSWPPG